MILRSCRVKKNAINSKERKENTGCTGDRNKVAIVDYLNT